MGETVTRQQTLAGSGFEKYRKQTRRERFLSEMEEAVFWQELAAAIAPHYPKPQGAGRRRVGVERMLRMYFLQHWFNLSDPGVEEALYDSNAMRSFVGIDLGAEPAPDETTVCNFRHMMERHDLGGELFHAVGEYLAENGLKVNRGTIVDATIIDAPSSTKNREGRRDPEMRHTARTGSGSLIMRWSLFVLTRNQFFRAASGLSSELNAPLIGDRKQLSERKLGKVYLTPF